MKITKILLMGLLFVSLQAEKFDPKIYESNMQSLYTSLTAKDADNLRLCRIYAEQGKKYKALNKNDEHYNEIVKNCERRVKLYCGALQESKLEENKK